MKSDPTYSEHYRTLGLTQECSWNEVRRGYRKLIKKWHPDQYHNESDELRLQAEKKTQELNIAYNVLEAYYKKTGTLPREEKPAPPPPKENVDTSQSNRVAPGGVAPHTRHNAQREYGNRASATERSQGKHRFIKLAIIGIAAYFSYSLWWSPEEYAPEPTTRSQTQSPNQTLLLGENPEKYHSSSELFFYPGSPKSEVFAAQGKPDQENEDSWVYGKSVVYFENGRVIQWADDPDSPLRVKLARDHFAREGGGGTEIQHLRVGLSKDEVRRIQGIPMQETTDIWYYGVSKIYFKDDQVSSWYDSPMNPLKTGK